MGIGIASKYLHNQQWNIKIFVCLSIIKVRREFLIKWTFIVPRKLVHKIDLTLVTGDRIHDPPQLRPVTLHSDCWQVLFLFENLLSVVSASQQRVNGTSQHTVARICDTTGVVVRCAVTNPKDFTFTIPHVRGHVGL